MSARIRRRAATGVAALLALAVSGCGLGTAGGRVLSGDLAGPVEGISLDGAEISVGSKNFSESVILGKIATTMFASAGAEVADLTNIPGSAAARQAQLDGQIDTSWEYTGTAWITYFGEDTVITDPQESWEAVSARDQEDNDITWLPPAPMNNTYGFAVTREFAERTGITKLSEIQDLPVDQRTFCIESEFANRPDGLPGMLKAYDIPEGPNGVPRDNLQTYQTGAIYTATAEGECNFGEVFTTDGRIKALDLQVLEDDRAYFPNYSVSLTIRDDLLDDYPQIADLINPISAKLTDEVLIELNSQVDVEGREPVEVAYDWLVEQGFITE
nr:glycine betaine ABC transporter substrate-binding protein [Nocardioides insulae]